MKIKFNHFERVAGLFVATALLGSLAVSVGVAIKKGWFATKIRFETYLPSADGIHSGTLVQIAGLRAGQVDDVELLSAEKIKVNFSVLDKFSSQIRQDSMVQVLRPFVIGEKVLEITVGSEDKPPKNAGETIEVSLTFDIMDIFSGKKIGPLLGTIEKLSENLRILGEAFADPERTRQFVKMFDRMAPLVGHLNEMAIGVSKTVDSLNRDKRIGRLSHNLVQVSQQLAVLLPDMMEETPDAGRRLGQTLRHLSVLTVELEKLAPAIATIAPSLPKTSLRAVEALDETVVLLKALQKSFLLRGNVKEVKEEETRKPAGE